MHKRRRHRWPLSSILRINRVIAISSPISNPTEKTAIGHRDRHAEPTRRNHVPKRRFRFYLTYRFKNSGFIFQRKPAQQKCTWSDLLLPRLYAFKQIQRHILTSHHEK